MAFFATQDYLDAGHKLRERRNEAGTWRRQTPKRKTFVLILYNKVLIFYPTRLWPRVPSRVHGNAKGDNTRRQRNRDADEV